MPRRRKGQCLDFAIGGLKKLAYDEKVSATVRLEALKLMLMLDDVYPKAAEALPLPIPPTMPSEDTLLASLRAKHGVSGGANATAQDS